MPQTQMISSPFGFGYLLYQLNTSAIETSYYFKLCDPDSANAVGFKFTSIANRQLRSILNIEDVSPSSLVSNHAPAEPERGAGLVTID